MSKIKSTAVQKVFCGNNIELLKEYPDNYFDSIVTDPPYGLGKEPNAEEMLSAWLQHGYLEVNGSGFMGKEWDAFVPQPIFWKEVFRVLKHGGHVVSFFGTRTYDWGVMAMRLAGFEVRDCIQWIYGSGFPKSHNVSKAIDKIYGAEREIIAEHPNSASTLGNGQTMDGGQANKNFMITASATTQAKQWDGWGSALKPANEPIVLARKPLEKGLSIAENVLKWNTGAINIEASRVEGEARTMPIFLNDTKEDQTTFNLNANIQHHREETNQGRFPSNVILSHHPECICKSVKVKSEIKEQWNCVDDCPIKIMDEQSGITISGKVKSEKESYLGESTTNFLRGKSNEFNQHGDTGGASRFFYVAKASQEERNFGLDGFEEKQTLGGGGLTAKIKPDGSYDTASAGGKYGSVKAKQRNTHPTVKPVKLMQYLVRMITPPNGTVLDPFSGSGTTGIACKIDGFNYVGLELDQEYCDIAQNRIDSFEEEKKFIDECAIYESTKNELPNQTSIFDFLDEE